MSMTYKAELNYAVVEGKEDKSSRDAVPVRFFQVDGGTNRFIKVGSTGHKPISFTSTVRIAKSADVLVSNLPDKLKEKEKWEHPG